MKNTDKNILISLLFIAVGSLYAFEFGVLTNLRIVFSLVTFPMFFTLFKANLNAQQRGLIITILVIILIYIFVK